MKKLNITFICFLCMTYSFAKEGYTSFKTMVKEHSHIFGGKLIERIEKKKETYYKLVILDQIKGHINLDTITIQYMYEGEGRSHTYWNNNATYAVCIVNQHNQDYFYSSIAMCIQPLNTLLEYDSWINYTREGYNWINHKNLTEKQQLKNRWISNSINDTIVQSQIAFELSFGFKEYGKLDKNTQILLKEYIIKNFKKDFYSSDVIKAVTGKTKKETIKYMLSFISPNHPNICELLHSINYALDKLSLYILSNTYCESKIILSDVEKNAILDKFKKKALQ